MCKFAGVNCDYVKKIQAEILKEITRKDPVRWFLQETEDTFFVCDSFRVYAIGKDAFCLNPGKFEKCGLDFKGMIKEADECAVNVTPTGNIVKYKKGFLTECAGEDFKSYYNNVFFDSFYEKGTKLYPAKMTYKAANRKTLMVVYINGCAAGAILPVNYNPATA